MNGCILLHPNQIIKRIKRAYREIDLVIIHNNETIFDLYVEPLRCIFFKLEKSLKSMWKLIIGDTESGI